MKIRQKLLTIIFSLEALFWLFLSAIYLIVRHGYVIPGLMVVNALVFAVFIWNIKKKNRQIQLIALFYLLINIILTITDQFGWLDMVILIVNVIALPFLFLDIRPLIKK